MRVATFAGQVVLVLAAIELDAPLHQLADYLGRALHCLRHDAVIAQTGAGVQRVLYVGLVGVVRIRHRGYAALSPVSGSALDVTLAQNGNTSMLGEVQSGRQAGRAAADDENVCGEPLAHVHRPESVSQLV